MALGPPEGLSLNNGFKAKVSGLWEAFTYLFAFNKEVVGLG